MSTAHDSVLKEIWSKPLIEVTSENLDALEMWLEKNPEKIFKTIKGFRMEGFEGEFAPCLLGIILYAQVCHETRQFAPDDRVKELKVLWNKALEIMKPHLGNGKFSSNIICEKGASMVCLNADLDICVKILPKAMTGSDLLLYYLKINKYIYRTPEIQDLINACEIKISPDLDHYLSSGEPGDAAPKGGGSTGAASGAGEPVAEAAAATAFCGIRRRPHPHPHHRRSPSPDTDHSSRTCGS